MENPKLCRGLLVTAGSRKTEGRSVFRLSSLKSWDQLEAMIWETHNGSFPKIQLTPELHWEAFFFFPPKHHNEWRI